MEKYYRHGTWTGDGTAIRCYKFGLCVIQGTMFVYAQVLFIFTVINQLTAQGIVIFYERQNINKWGLNTWMDEISCGFAVPSPFRNQCLIAKQDGRPRNLFRAGFLHRQHTLKYLFQGQLCLLCHSKIKQRQSDPRQTPEGHLK